VFVPDICSKILSEEIPYSSGQTSHFGHFLLRFYIPTPGKIISPVSR